MDAVELVKRPEEAMRQGRHAVTLTYGVHVRQRVNVPWCAYSYAARLRTEAGGAP
ncbi:hypothetical protein AB0G85_02410 [Streptomyces sioyaensis]|uniref:hypothetical protein n=1 Tax=Streptomyces sioyaensis TaxID=67364 RepID=UPI0034032744